MTLAESTSVATRSSRHRDPLPVLQKLYDDCDEPWTAENQQAIRAAFIAKTNGKNGSPYFSDFRTYWLKHHMKWLLDIRMKRRKSSEQLRAEREARVAAKAKEDEEIDKDVEDIKRDLWLDFPLSNGKKLSQSSKEEIAADGAVKSKDGAWLMKVADRLKPGEIAGEVLTEQDVRKLRNGNKA